MPAPPKAPLWTRPALDRDRPDRRSANLYRTAERAGGTLGGVPLGRTEDAVVAAVRMAYDVANAQIDRGARLAARLRAAGDRAGGQESDRQAVDAAERLVFGTFMAGLGWLEGLAAERGSPLKRLVEVQYRLLGAVLGFRDDGATSGSRPAGAEAPGRAPGQGTPPAAAANRCAPAAEVRIVHLAKAEERRAVRIVALELRVPAVARTSVVFYGDGADDPGLAAAFVKEGAGARLEVLATREIPPGPRTAAICDESGLQVGWIEIEL